MPPGDGATFGLDLYINRPEIHKFYQIVGFSDLPHLAVEFVGSSEGAVDSGDGSAFAFVDLEQRFALGVEGEVGSPCHDDVGVLGKVQ